MREPPMWGFCSSPLVTNSLVIVRLNYEWKHNGYRDLQPQVINGDSILLPTGMGSGTRCIRVAKNGEQYSAEERWTSSYRDR